MQNDKNEYLLENEVYKMTPNTRIKNIMEQQNISKTKMAKDLNIEYTTLISMFSKKSMPPVNKIGVIADYLGVDVRYLITGKHEMCYSEIPDEDREMLKTFHGLSAVRKAEIRNYIKLLYNAENSDDQYFKVK